MQKQLSHFKLMVHTSQEIEKSFSMNTNLQVDEACKQIANDTNLKNGYNAIGFSQGGQFL